MSMTSCEVCHNRPIDSDYHPEIFKYGFDMNYKTGQISFTGKDNSAVALCDDCTKDLLNKFDVNEEYYADNFL